MSSFVFYECVYDYAYAPKTVRVKRTFLNIAMLGWGGVGWGVGDVNVPCTSYMIHCYAAEISGNVYYVTCCYAADGVGWGVNVPCTSYMIHCYAAEISGIVYYVTCCYAADGVGWGGGGCSRTC